MASKIDFWQKNQSFFHEKILLHINVFMTSLQRDTALGKHLSE